MKPVRNADVMIKKVGDESLLYRADDKAIHVLNGTAKLIWELSDGEHDMASIEESVRSSFAVPEGHDVTTDIKQVLKVMSEKGLLTI
jgi:predicted ATPase